MERWKVNKVMAIWGISFGVVATLTGVLLLKAVEGGFLAESFFLIVISWVLVLVLIAKLTSRTGKKREGDWLENPPEQGQENE